MSIKHENFDARVVGIVSGQIPKSEEDVEKTYFYVFDEESQSLIPAPRIHIALQSKERLEGYRQDRKGGVWSFLEDAGVERRERILEERLSAVDLSPELLKVIMNGRVHVSILLHTNGGDGRTTEIILKSIDLWKRNGGQIDTYAPMLAASNGAEIWSVGDNKYACKDTIALWHIGEPTFEMTEGNMALLEERVEKELEEEEKEEEDPDEKYREKLKKQFKAAKDCEEKERTLHAIEHHPNAEFTLTGEELDQMGLVTNLFDSWIEMERYLEVRSGFEIHGKADLRDLNEFCRDMGLKYLLSLAMSRNAPEE